MLYSFLVNAVYAGGAQVQQAVQGCRSQPQQKCPPPQQRQQLETANLTHPQIPSAARQKRCARPAQPRQQKPSTAGTVAGSAGADEGLGTSGGHTGADGARANGIPAVTKDEDGQGLLSEGHRHGVQASNQQRPEVMGTMGSSVLAPVSTAGSLALDSPQLPAGESDLCPVLCLCFFDAAIACSERKPRCNSEQDELVCGGVMHMTVVKRAAVK